MTSRTPFKRLILRAVLRDVSPMVIRVVAVPDYLNVSDFDEVFRTVLDWNGLGFSFHVHGQEFSSFHRAMRAKILRDFQLRPREKYPVWPHTPPRIARERPDSVTFDPGS